MKMGRPTIGAAPKRYCINLRMSDEAGAMLDEISSGTGRPRVSIIEDAIKRSYADFIYSAKKAAAEGKEE